VVAPPTYNIVDELKAEGDWEVLQKYSGFEFDDNAQKLRLVPDMKIFFI
jgi:aconitate hydratase 2/2-methylisocitrate dehydratase